jgi:hypothetical protein
MGLALESLAGENPTLRLADTTGPVMPNHLDEAKCSGTSLEPLLTTVSHYAYLDR